MMSSVSIHRIGLPWMLSVLLFAATAPAAQPVQPSATAQGIPNALQGFSHNRDEPVKIDSDSLEVRDKDKVATFLGNVHVVQGDTTMRCQTLVVFYEQSAAPGSATASTLKAAQPGAGGQQ